MRELRRSTGLSQEQLASASGLDRTYIGGIERGERNPTLKTIVWIADALGVPPSVLLETIPSSKRTRSLRLQERVQ